MRGQKNEANKRLVLKRQETKESMPLAHPCCRYDGSLEIWRIGQGFGFTCCWTGQSQAVTCLQTVRLDPTGSGSSDEEPGRVRGPTAPEEKLRGVGGAYKHREVRFCFDTPLAPRSVCVFIFFSDRPCASYSPFASDDLVSVSTLFVLQLLDYYQSRLYSRADYDFTLVSFLNLRTNRNHGVNSSHPARGRLSERCLGCSCACSSLLLSGAANPKPLQAHGSARRTPRCGRYQLRRRDDVSRPPTVSQA